MSYEVKLEQFEGPLDLLLSLISRKELDIYDISLADITDEYLGFIEKMKDLNLEIASEFLLIAATLLEIKSRGLLPGEEAEAVENLSADEVKKALIKKLVAYKKFKNVASFLKQSLDVGSKYHKREAELEERFVGLMPDFDEDINPTMIVEHLLHIIRVRHFATVNTEHITPLPLSVEEQVDYLLTELKDGPRQFKDLTNGYGRQEVIVTFLAVLELCKRSMVDVKQSGNFGELEIELLEETISA